jgi:hypothetical protein
LQRNFGTTQLVSEKLPIVLKPLAKITPRSQMELEHEDSGSHRFQELNSGL